MNYNKYLLIFQSLSHVIVIIRACQSSKSTKQMPIELPVIEEGIKKKLNALFVKAYITSLQMKV